MSSIFDICRTGELADLERVLKTEGLDINAKENEQEAALHIACARGALPFVARLMQVEGIDPHLLYFQKSPLAIAIEGKFREIIKYLLAQKVNINKGGVLFTAVAQTTSHGKPKEVEGDAFFDFLMDEGIDVNGDSFINPLGHALIRCHLYAAKRLLSSREYRHLDKMALITFLENSHNYLRKNDPLAVEVCDLLFSIPDALKSFSGHSPFEKAMELSLEEISVKILARLSREEMHPKWCQIAIEQNRAITLFALVRIPGLMRKSLTEESLFSLALHGKQKGIISALLSSSELDVNEEVDGSHALLLVTNERRVDLIKLLLAREDLSSDAVNDAFFIAAQRGFYNCFHLLNLDPRVTEAKRQEAKEELRARLHVAPSYGQCFTDLN